MVKIRLFKKGKKGEAHFRVVVMDSRKPRDSKFIADLGFYNPYTKEFKVNEEEVKSWLKQGAQPTDTVGQYLVKLGLLKKWRKTKRSTQSEPKKDNKTDKKKNTTKKEKDTEDKTSKTTNTKTQKESKNEKKDKKPKK